MKLTEFRKLIREEIRKVIKEATVTSGMTIDDWDLVDKKIIKPKHQDDWLELFSDEGDINFKSSASVKKFTKMANEWLEDNGYTWRVAMPISQNDEGEITWKIA